MMKMYRKCVIIFRKQKGVMTYYNVNKYISFAMADLETAFLFYLCLSCVCTFFS